MSPRPWPGEQALLATLEPWLRQRRWCPLKGLAQGAGTGLRLVTSVELAEGVRDLVVAVPRGAQEEGAQGVQPPVLLHVPVVLDEAGALERLAAPGESAEVVGVVLPATTTPGASAPLALVDGAHHPAFWRAWAQAALEAGTVLDARGAQAVSQRAEHLRLTTGEQSNTSVVMPAVPGQAGAFGQDLIVKVLRVLEAGRNPDVEVPVALARAGWDRVRRPVAWSTLRLPGGQEADSAVACTFIPAAQDGFELFCSLARQDAGAGSAERERARALAHSLGQTTAQMHHHLAQALGTASAPPPAQLAQRLEERARWAWAEVPQLGQVAPQAWKRVEGLYARLAGLDALPQVCRVHGDYHLGQVLLAHPTAGAPERWYVLDFEGEPLRPLAQRLERDQPLRDTAGMLRSFDYAAAVGPAQDGRWLEEVRTAFLEGAAQGSQVVPDPVVLKALELDKALYEAVYEARNRPDWLGVPLAGVSRLLAATGPSA